MARIKPGPLYVRPRPRTWRGASPLLGLDSQFGGPRRWSAGRWGAVLVAVGVLLIWAWMVHGELEPGPRLAAVPPSAQPSSAGPSSAERVSAQQQLPAGPKAQSPPHASNGQKRRAVPQHPVRSALLRAARNCVARRVIAVWGSVREIGSMRAADVDLLVRGLSLVGFPLREALIRHRTREPKRYARRHQARTAAALRRTLTTRNLRVFLSAFGEELPIGTGVEDAPNWLPGDIVLVKPSPRRAKLMIAIISDRTDDDGVPLLFTLDPADKVAREIHGLDDYPVHYHFRLAAEQIARARHKLGMPIARLPTPRMPPARAPVTL